MKKIILLVVLLLIVFVVMSKHRLYVRDPLANVTRNGVKEAGAQVFIDFDNDVLIQNDNAGPGLVYVELIHHDMPVGTPASLTCMHWIACLAEADQPRLAQLHEGAKVASMDAKTVKFMDSDKRDTVVTLR